MALTVKIRGDASQFEKTMRGVNRSVSNVGAKIAGIGAAGLAAAGAYVSLGQAMEFLNQSSSKAAGMEDLTQQIGMLVGSTDKAKSMIKEFRDEAAKSQLSSEDYAQAAKTMMAFGISVDDTLPMMRALADISMGNADRFGSLALAFSQTQAAGRLMGQEVLQFVNAGFNPLQQIALKTGESMATLKKRMEDGGISAQEVTQAFKDATSAGGKFYKAIELGANNTNAKIAQTKDNVDKLQIAFGTGFNEGLKDALDATNNYLPQLESKFADAGNFIGMALTDSLSGDTKKFELVGKLIGAILASGVKEGFKQTILGTVEGMYIDILEKIEKDKNNDLANEIATKAAKESDPIKKQQLLEDAAGVFNRKPMIREQYNLGNEYASKTNNFVSGFKDQLNAVNLESQIAQGMKTGIDESMSQAVRQGVLEAMQKQPTGAKFSN